MKYAKIVGTGSCLPDRIVKNDDFPESLQTSDEWIRTRTGICQRHLATEDALSSDFGVEAGRNALKAASLLPEDIDLIIVATSTPDQIFPSTACIVQEKIGNTSAAAFDVQAVCAGFIYALSIADQFIRSGQYRNALVIGVDVFSHILDWQDRGTCVLFGDGAGAVVLQAAGEPGIVGSVLKADGRYRKLLETPGRISHGTVSGAPFVKMDGGAVFKFAVKALTDVAEELLAQHNLDASTIDWLVPHQANIRIVEATAKRLKLPMENVALTVSEHGNTSAASIPLALDNYIKAGKIVRGQRLLMAGIGGGFAWGAVLVDY